MDQRGNMAARPAAARGAERGIGVVGNAALKAEAETPHGDGPEPPGVIIDAAQRLTILQCATTVFATNQVVDGDIDKARYPDVMSLAREMLDFVDGG